MLNFKNTNIFFVLILAGLIYLHTQHGMPWYVYVLLFFVYSLILFYGSYYVGSNFYLKTICEGDVSKKQVALTFDDGPAVEYTPGILDILKSNDVPGTFFCIGNRIAGNESLLQRIHEEGHIIGNHSYSHGFWFDMLMAPQMQQDIEQMNAETQRVTGLKPRLFRPPYGVTTPPMNKALRRGNFKAIGWNIRSLDTVIKEEVKLLGKLQQLLKPGAIVLLHDTSKTTFAVLPQFIAFAKKQGYEFVRLDKMINEKAYA